MDQNSLDESRTPGAAALEEEPLLLFGFVAAAAALVRNMVGRPAEMTLPGEDHPQNCGGR